MSNSLFAKLARECHLIHSKRCTSTDIDLIFNKVKAKGQRKITFTMFKNALVFIAVKLHPKVDDATALAAVETQVANTRKAGTSGTKADTSGVYSKLTDASQYTGKHKNVHGSGTPVKPQASPRRPGNRPALAGRSLVQQ